ncbi:VOC family protein [Exiguobacterium sp. B2(2022)]|uniref:VOC family protein n=1 Tax=Exiguobacterium sp. B2(2022) TaxID=2992755 RepID=UPI00237A4F19|nr:VOC family protein [Exiguobacterium sp. B2(2022)]MDE0562815.1 VOC family protein [Exiguobacterium sp. B2(2022)]
MITGIHHVQLTIPTGAEREAKAFYCDFLGLSEIEKPDSLKERGGFWLQVGDQSVHVGTENGVERNKTKAHIAYAVTDLGHWKAALTENEIVYSEGIPIPGFDRFEFRDPFGNRVEMIQAL